MVLSPPSALAAAIRASMFPPAPPLLEAAGEAAPPPPVDAPAVGADDEPDDEHAASTKLATTRRPATRVTVRWVDNIRPPVACVVTLRRLRGPPSPGRAIGSSTASVADGGTCCVVFACIGQPA